MLGTFLLITLIFFIGDICIGQLFLKMIQPGAPIDILWKFITKRSYSDMLADLFGSGVEWKINLGKALGDCDQCFSFWFQPIWFAIYYGFCKVLFHWWITDLITAQGVSRILAIVFIDIVWLANFWAIAANFLPAVSIWIKKLSNRKDAVL